MIGDKERDRERRSGTLRSEEAVGSLLLALYRGDESLSFFLVEREGGVRRGGKQTRDVRDVCGDRVAVRGGPMEEEV